MLPHSQKKESTKMLYVGIIKIRATLAMKDTNLKYVPKYKTLNVLTAKL